MIGESVAGSPETGAAVVLSLVFTSAFVGVDQIEFGGAGRLATGPHDLDIAKVRRLVDVDHALFEQLQNCEESHNDLEFVDERSGQLPERDAPDPREFIDELRDRFDNRHPDGSDVKEVDSWFGPRGRRTHECRAELEWGDTDERIGRQIDESLVGTDATGETVARSAVQLGEYRCSVLERLAFEEAGQQQVPLLPQAELVVEVTIVEPRQQSASLEFDQRRRDQQEFGRDVEVELLDLGDVGEIRVDDRGERHLVQVHLVTKNQVQQKVERPLEHSRLHVDRHRGIVPGVPPELQRRHSQTPPLRWPAMARVFSGIQPTGDLHLGNYLGAVVNWVRDLDIDDAVYCVVDLHAITIPKDPAELVTRTRDLVALLIACGLDTDRCTLFVQSHVPQHAQLAWIMQCNVSFGELGRMTQFKDKSERQQFISAGLFTYPALQAADILLYDTEKVPVGADQKQHIELCRDAAERFNNRFGPTFVVPEHSTPAAGARVMDLQNPEAKMSKSLDSPQGTVLVTDDPKAIEKKFKRAVTDSDGEVRFDIADKPGVSNLLSILGGATQRDPSALAADFSQYGELKAACAEAVIECLMPVQRRYAELRADPAELDRLIAVGADKAEAVAGRVLARVERAVGIGRPS